MKKGRVKRRNEHRIEWVRVPSAADTFFSSYFIGRQSNGFSVKNAVE